ncbi:MAG TPA: hydroxymethylglutaryl-CoA synthase family protein [Nanoarchaeota archaeon]|nr:hydroxymethylglutaryl-CoA synthase family protein [Nanoarchaeota archaeon]
MNPGAAVGIDALYAYIPGNYVDVRELAEKRANGRDTSKILSLVGQKEMAIPFGFEDPVTMAANAVAGMIRHFKADVSKIERIVMATESAFDFSKAGSSFVHEMAKLKRGTEVYEVKHACASGTYALLDAVNAVRAGEIETAVVVMSDICRYKKGSSAEYTQGAGAVALLVAKNPKILAISPGTGTCSFNVADFYRPAGSETPVVDGRLSMESYIKAVCGSFSDYVEKAQIMPHHLLAAMSHIIFHTPFPKMAENAFFALCKETGCRRREKEDFERKVKPSLSIPSSVGNVYTASLYLALASALENATRDDIAGLFSYGSGCTSKFFAGRVAPQAGDRIRSLGLLKQLSARRRLSIAEYERVFYEGGEIDNEYRGFRVRSIRNGYREYGLV